jgi:hypothetical protein
MFDGYAGVWDFTRIGSTTSMVNTFTFFIVIFVRSGTHQLLENTSKASPRPFYTLVSKGSQLLRFGAVCTQTLLHLFLSSGRYFTVLALSTVRSYTQCKRYTLTHK